MSLALFVPSLTATVIIVVPVWICGHHGHRPVGVRRHRSRWLLLVRNQRAGFDGEPPASVRFVAGASASKTVNVPVAAGGVFTVVAPSREWVLLMVGAAPPPGNGLCRRTQPPAKLPGSPRGRHRYTWGAHALAVAAARLRRSPAVEPAKVRLAGWAETIPERSVE